MPHRYADIAFTPTVKKAQEQFGSRNAYARMEGAPETRNHRLSEAEAQFIAARDSFYMATVSETGWPYIQHRGGPIGIRARAGRRPRSVSRISAATGNISVSAIS